MPKTRAPYPEEFRAEMVRLVRAGRTPGALSREFEPSDQTIHNWVNQADIDEGRKEGLTTTQLDALRQLRRENRILREEKEILAKAAAWFAEKSSDRPRGSVWVRESQIRLHIRTRAVNTPRGRSGPDATRPASQYRWDGEATHMTVMRMVGSDGSGLTLVTTGRKVPLRRSVGPAQRLVTARLCRPRRNSGCSAPRGCVRQSEDKAIQLFEWASVGTPVVVLA